MAIIEKLPWYDDYIFILEGRRIAEKGIEDLENPEKQLQRIKKFYKNLGADYSKNNLLVQVEEKISNTNKGKDSRLRQLKREVRFGSILESAVQKQDDESIVALNIYKDNELYKQLIRKVMFYIGVSKVKKEPEFIKKAYDGVYKTYSLKNVSLFVDEGVYYYIYYFQCLQILIKEHKGRVSYDEICAQIRDRCYNAKLMLNRYSTDMYLADEVQLILFEVEAVEAMLNDEGDDI